MAIRGAQSASAISEEVKSGSDSTGHRPVRLPMARIAPLVATMGPVVRIELERVEALELLGMTLAHLKDAEARPEMSPKMALLMAIRNKLALGLREER
jgi:hypothetical protein